jgi:hypothetical protein
MKKLPISLSLAAVATLAACGHSEPYVQPVTPAPAAAVYLPAPVAMAPTVVYPSTYPSGTVVIPYSGTVVASTVAPVALRPGFGRVEANLTIVDTNGVATGMRRLTLKMDDGTIQVLDTRGPTAALGERVEITPDRFIRYPIAMR